jgi:hypothetical protein
MVLQKTVVNRGAGSGNGIPLLAEVDTPSVQDDEDDLLTGHENSLDNKTASTQRSAQLMTLISVILASGGA